MAVTKTEALAAPSGPAPSSSRRRQRRADRVREPYAPMAVWSTGSRVTMYVTLGLGLFVFALFGIIPSLGNLVISFTDYTALPGLGTSFIGVQNYTQLVTTQLPGFVGSLEATVIFVVGVTVLQNAIGLMMAHRMSDTSKNSAVLRALAFMPIVLGVTVVGLIWLLLFNPAGGPAAHVLGLVGGQSSFFGSNSLAMPLVILVQVWQNLGFTMILFVGGLKSIPASVYEAAALDGVSPWERFTKITWPLMAPSVTVNVLFAVIGATTTYNLIYVLTSGANGTNTLGMLAFNAAFGQTSNLGFGAAVTTALFVFTAVVAIPTAALLRARERRILG